MKVNAYTVPGLFATVVAHSPSDSQVNQFVKLVSATPSQVLTCITGPEREALKLQVADLAEDEASELCFIEAALQNLKVSY